MLSVLRCSGLVIFASAFVLALPAEMCAQESVKSPAPAGPITPASSSDPADPVALFSRISPAVVKLILQDDKKKEIGAASAFAMRIREGVFGFVTNFHALRGVPNATVQFEDGDTASVDMVLVEDESVDLVVFLAETTKKPSTLVDIEQGVVPLVGTRVFVIGSPKGLTNTLSEGLVSGYRDRAKGSKWVQITAPMSAGSSGGPVLTGDGRLVGVATASVIDGQNLNFAVPASEVRNLVTVDALHGRLLWKGASISRAREYAYRSAMSALKAKFRADHPEPNDDDFDAAFKKYYGSKGESADQLGLVVKGYLEYQEKKYEEAVRTLTLATRSKPGEFEYLAHFALAETHYEIEHAWAYKNAGFDPKAAAYLDPTVFSRTVAALLEAKRANPSFAPTLDFLAGCYKSTKQYPEALVAAEFLVQEVPQCAGAYERRGEIYDRLGRHQSALQDFKTAVELNPNSSARFNLADTFGALGRHEESIAVYEDLIARGPEPIWVLYWNMGIEFEAIAKYERAIAAFEQAIQILRREDTAVSRAQIPSMQERLARCRARVK